MTNKCTCGEKGYDDCYCPTPEPKQYRDEVETKKLWYCRNCLRIGELSRLIKKGKPGFRAYYCRRCAARDGAGFYGSCIATCGYDSVRAKKELTLARNRAKRQYDNARAAFAQLRKDIKDQK